MKCNSDYHADICPARRRNGDCVSEYPCRHKVEPPKPKTNADHIRYMTDEELAEFIATTFENGRISVFAIYPELTENHCGLDWLRQPYKEDL